MAIVLVFQPESPVKHLEIQEEIPIPDSPPNRKAQFPDYSSSPPLYEFWKDEENLADFKLIESPPKMLLQRKRT